MLGHRELGFDDYIEMLRRRIWVILIPTLLVPVAAYLVSLKIPNRYTSQTLILVENQKVPQNYVAPVVTEDLAFRLATMREQVLSRTRLQPILERLRLYGGGASLDDKVAKMNNDIMIKPVVSSLSRRGADDLPGFTISFTYEDARLAQQVCGEVTSMFIEENLKSRQQSAEGTNQFLERELEESKKKMDEHDARLAKFRIKYLGQLPDQAQGNLNVLMGLNSQLDAVNQAIARAQQDKTYTESILAQQLSAWESTQADGASANPASLQQQLANAQDQLLVLQARYTDDHPDIARLKSDIAQLKRKLQEAETAEKKPPSASEQRARSIEPPAIQQLRTTLRQYDQTIKEKAHDQDRLREQIRLYQSRIQLTPVVEEEHKQLTRDYQQSLAFYNDLLRKKQQSQLATNLEMRQQGEYFRVMDPPNLPESPTYPNRPLIALGGLGGGIGLGLVLAFVMEMLDKSLRTEADVIFHLKLPALALLPAFGDDAYAIPANQRKLHFWRKRKERQGVASQTIEV